MKFQLSCGDRQTELLSVVPELFEKPGGFAGLFSNEVRVLWVFPSVINCKKELFEKGSHLLLERLSVMSRFETWLRVLIAGGNQLKSNGGVPGSLRGRLSANSECRSAFGRRFKGTDSAEF